MTALVQDPTDHWLDLRVAQPRKPLLDEMMSAYNCALLAPTDPGHRRAAWIGVGTGYAVAFGFVTREALERARRVPGALTVHPREFHPSPFNDVETAWASGVLYGYYLGTSEGMDVTTCTHCGQRLAHNLDYIVTCHHGDFCDDCVTDWHRDSTPAHPGDVCTFEADRYEDAS
jgi:hypothetical protein